MTDSIAILNRFRSPLARYGVAVLAVALALPFKVLLDQLVEPESPFLMLLAAIMVSALYGGLGPGLLATGIAAVISDYFFLSPGTLLFQSLGQNIRIGLFVLEGMLIAWLTAALSAAKWQTEANMQEAQHQKEFIRQSEEQFRLLVEGVKDYGIFMLDSDGRISSWNTGAERIMGYRADEIVGHHLTRLYPEEELARGTAEQELQVAAAEGRFEDEGRRMRKDGSYFWANVVVTALRDESGQLRGFAKVTRDVTERKQAEATLRHQALYDPLTGLANRFLFMDRLRHAVAHAQRHSTAGLAVLFLDLDRFKHINDSLGHFHGDQLLIQVARRLETCIRAEDTVARLGGDEFAMLLDDITDASDATHVALRIQEAFSTPFQLGGSEIVINTSIGITLSTTGSKQPEDLLREADIALYRAKAQGRARYAIFNPVMHAQAAERLQLESDLRQAIEREEFELYYQPIVSLASGTINGVEALVRWQHPTRGLLPPAQFIPVAEETGLIVPLGEWVLRTACTQIRAWDAAGLPPVTVAVNLSARQLRNTDLPTKVANILAETGVDPQALKLELTESSVMENAKSAITLLKELHGLGVQLALDDFGTGYSCLSYLKSLPITSVKIDRSFVRDLPINPNDAAIATAVIALAHSLNLTVVAEGVETEAQLGFFRTQQADAVQGYLISRPVPAEPLTGLLQQARDEQRTAPLDRDTQPTLSNIQRANRTR
jgi:diguanylate cyclase (GGDEF)-like protein/PAS domain S-box-containing protein